MGLEQHVRLCQQADANASARQETTLLQRAAYSAAAPVSKISDVDSETFKEFAMRVHFMEGLASTVNDALMNLFRAFKNPTQLDHDDARNLALEIAEPFR
jgi:hypothetical protein